ncbi:ParM/StbA family protein [Thalassospira xiamenensis]|uniref:Plasmid segregation actin-type ATPase ParM n=1 Tax=Thalassospira xiamenensis TaxID=220697 RepID=A0A285TV96_9PROT|nr:ParM/StbA family protein [Thalassospira xiamenensis]SOC25938.1 plasmid segregation actin-type ATPase ParM [Thalassospira xiamenensis]
MSKTKTSEKVSSTTAPQTKPLLVAIDDGYAQTKLYGEGPDGKKITLKMRSSVRPGRHGLTALSGRGDVGSYTTEEGEKFTASEEIEAESTQFDTFHVSTMNRVLVNHALISAGYGGLDVDLVTGLPVDDYFIDSEKNNVRIEAKRANLGKGVSSTNPTERPVASLKSITVNCQAVAAFVDYITGDDLEERADPTGKFAVVDIGGRTTDVAVIVNGESLDNSMSGTANIGVLDVYSAVNRAIGNRFDFHDRLPTNTIDAAVRTGKINLWGDDHDVTDLVKGVVLEQEGKIAREVERRLGSAASLNKVLFVGGGSALFKTIAEHFRNGHMAEDPEFSNARGMFKYARLFA